MIRNYFNEKAATWDSYASERNTDKLYQMVNRLDLKPGNTVLDIGTGTGVFLPYIVKMVGINGLVLAIDIAEKMLLQARNKGYNGKISFLCADVEEIPLRAEICDAVTCYSSIPHFQDKLKALIEIRRVLKRGGSVFICHTSGRNEINRIHMNISLLYHDLLPNSTDMTQLLETAGFIEIRVEDKDESYFACGRKTVSD